VVKYIRSEEQDALVYSDGVPEDRLYMNLKRDQIYRAHREDFRRSSWAEEYHLSPLRHNLLKWFPFAPGSTTLEIGAGCGALTGLLCLKSKKVVALEYSRQRALITATRHSNCSNLDVIVGGLQDFETDDRFDYITVIGVLEYAAKFYGGKTPHKSFLTKLKGMLKPGGALILAIENKIGLKYICGAQEDHTGRVFDSIYDYPYGHGVHTFSKKELSDILYAAGFGSLDWYYPLPDYKMPQQVISEKVTPTDLDSIWRLFPAKTARHRRKEIISERRFGRTLTQAGLFGEFANSFLVIAKLKDTPGERRCLRFTGANMGRKRKFRTNKEVRQDGGEKLFILSPHNDESIEFVREIVEREALAKRFFGSEAEVVTGNLNGNSLIYPYLAFPSLAELIGSAISDGDARFGRFWIDEYLRFLLRLPTKTCVPEEFMRELGIAHREVRKPLRCLCCGILDCVPHNILVDEKAGKWYVIDNEFTYDFPVPIDFVIWRAIHTLVVGLQSQIQSHVCQERPVVVFGGHWRNRDYIPLSWLDVLTGLDIPPKQQARWSTAFQNKIIWLKSKLHSRLKRNPKAFVRVPITETMCDQGVVRRIHVVLRKIKRAL